MWSHWRLQLLAPRRPTLRLHVHSARPTPSTEHSPTSPPPCHIPVRRRPKLHRICARRERLPDDTPPSHCDHRRLPIAQPASTASESTTSLRRARRQLHIHAPLQPTSRHVAAIFARSLSILPQAFIAAADTHTSHIVDRGPSPMVFSLGR